MNSSDELLSSAEFDTVSPWQWPEVASEESFSSALQRDLEEEERKLPEADLRLTAEALEKIQKQAFEEAANAGREAGYREGYAKGSQEGYQAGYDKGFQQGYREGKEKAEGQAKAQAEQALASEVAYLRQLMKALIDPLEQVDAQVEQELIALAMLTAKHLIRRELKTDPGQIVAVVREALALLPVARRHVTLVLHPKDAELVRGALDLGQSKVAWKIVEDPTLTRGGCRVETETSRIDATVENRLSAVIAAALGGERSGDG
ncbi:MAG: flagellar assembly protein FliH [Methylohalobius sp.]|nr:flagellar assembly protein FliH [Methylohalobius sp.]